MHQDDTKLIDLVWEPDKWGLQVRLRGLITPAVVMDARAKVSKFRLSYSVSRILCDMRKCTVAFPPSEWVCLAEDLPYLLTPPCSVLIDPGPGVGAAWEHCDKLLEQDRWCVVFDAPVAGLLWLLGEPANSTDLISRPAPDFVPETLRAFLE